MSQLKFEGLGSLMPQYRTLIQATFRQYDMEIQFVSEDEISGVPIISFDKKATEKLRDKNMMFYNWDLLFSVLGPNDSAGDLELKLKTRVEILRSVVSVKQRPIGQELHGSIRVYDLADSAGFYCWLFGVEPKEWTHRYVTFLRPDTKFNFVLVVSDDKQLNHDTLYHLGMGVSDKEDVVNFYHSAIANGFHIEKKPFTTWRGTPLHEVWFKDPNGTLIEVYARLKSEELALMPEDKKPTPLA